MEHLYKALTLSDIQDYHGNGVLEETLEQLGCDYKTFINEVLPMILNTVEDLESEESEYVNRISTLDDEIEGLETELEALRADVSELSDEVSSLEIDLENLQELKDEN